MTSNPKRRRAIHLRYWRDLSADEISATQQIPNGAVKARLHRGRRLLHDAMLAVALLASVIPARAAGRVDPIVVLRDS